MRIPISHPVPIRPANRAPALTSIDVLGREPDLPAETEPGHTHRVFRLVPITTFTTPTGASALVQIVLVKYVQMAPFVHGALIVRIHAVSSSFAWTAIARNVAYSPEEPGTAFSSGTDTRLSLPASGSPNLVVANLTTPISERLQLLLETPSSGGQSMTISVDLVARSQ